jgi:ATP-dependent Clp protease ATP-binding subunit ClpA
MLTLQCKPKNKIFYNYTYSAIKAIKNAKKIAREQNFYYVHSGHLLLSIINTKESLASKILCKDYLISEVKVKLEIIDILTWGMSLLVKRGFKCSNFSPRTRCIFANARTEAHRSKQNFISVDHLLLALLFETRGSAIVSLCRCGFRYDLPYMHTELVQKMKKSRINSLPIKVSPFIFSKKFRVKLTKYNLCVLVIFFITAVNYRKIYYVVKYIRMIYYLTKALKNSSEMRFQLFNLENG